MGMRLLITILLFFLSANLFSQADTAVVQLHVVDADNDPVHNAKVQFTEKNNIETIITSSRGNVYYRTTQDELNATINHSQFEPKSVHKKLRYENGDTILIKVQLNSIRTQDVIGTVVTAPGIPQIVYKSKRLHVEDFEIQNDGKFILLTYPKRLKKGSELVIYDGLNILNSFKVPEIAEELVHDYRGNTHVVCKENIYGIHVSPEEIGISQLPKEYYMTYLAPIVDTNKTKMYFSNFNPDYPAFEYFSFDQVDSTYKQIMQIEDELMMELYRSEYKWVDVRTKLWAKEKEYATGIDAEIWVGANYFTQSIYYEELYAPMFQRNDSIFVFDYYKDLLFTYDMEGNPIDSVEIYHHYKPRKSGWQKQLIQDNVTGEIYALFDRAGYSYLGRIDIKTGEVSEQVKLTNRYVGKIAIHNNFVYYVYRPFESVQKKYLYKERLPYDFGGAKMLDGDDFKIVEK